jgi:transposase
VDNFRITITKQNVVKLKQIQISASRRGDLRLFKRVSILIALGSSNTILLNELASSFGLSVQTIYLWITQFIALGFKCLGYKFSPGRPSKLTKKQKKELTKLIEAGPEAAGYPGACWRSPMIQNLIFKMFGVFFNVHYISELLKNLGFSYQKSKFEASHHDEEQREIWLKETWPIILEEAKSVGAYILFGDEASFPQWGSLSYTWAKVGQTPIVKTSGKRRGYKVFGFIEYYTGKFFSQAQDGRLTTETYLQFIEDVMDKTGEIPLFIIQDGAKYHTSKAANEFFLDNNDRLTVFQLPAYSPDFNPIEALWKKVKQTGTHLKYFETFEALTDQVDLLLTLFENEAKEVLKLFGFYNSRLG